jgi:hypothetical protein
VNRRWVLKGAGVGTIAAILFPGLSDVAGAVSSKAHVHAASVQGLDPNFASGRVLARTAFGMVVASGGSAQRVIHVDSSTQVWKEHSVSFAAIERDDFVDVAGIPHQAGSLIARQVWANIIRFGGEVIQAGTDSLTIRSANGVIATIFYSADLEVIADDGTPHPQGKKAIRRGRTVGGVGVLLKDGSRRATRVWLA